MATERPPGPGWYPDPADPGTNRYWDGGRWTENRAPIAAPAPGEVVRAKETNADGTIIAGYVLAALMPLIGFIIGLTQINRNRHGIWVVVVSIVAFFIWLAIFSGAAADSGTTY